MGAGVMGRSMGWQRFAVNGGEAAVWQINIGAIASPDEETHKDFEQVRCTHRATNDRNRSAHDCCYGPSPGRQEAEEQEAALRL